MMGRSYKFSIVQAKPDGMRGERVNVGLVTLGPKGIDVRMPEVRKLFHLTGHRWDDIAAVYSGVLTGGAQAVGSIEDLLEPSAFGSEVFDLSSPGELIADTEEEYEAAVRKVLNFFVDKPSLTPKEKQQRINSEISEMLRKGRLLGQKGKPSTTRR